MQLLSKLKENLPAQIILMILFIFFAGEFLPIELKRLFLTFSIFIKDCLTLALPYIIFSYIFSTLVSLRSGAVLFIGTLLLGVISLTALGLHTSFFLSGLLTEISGLKTVAIDHSKDLLPLWTLPVPDFLHSVLKNEYGLFGGVVGGLLLGYFKADRLSFVCDKLKAGASFFLDKLFVPVVPLFIFGFLIRMQHEGLLQYVISQYGPVYILIFTIQMAYMMGLLGVAASFNPKQWLVYFKNLLTPMATGVSTMSSAAAMPLSIKAAEANTGSYKIAASVIPATSNFNLLGDAICIPLMLIATMITFGHGIPSYETFGHYIFLYLGYMFTIAAVPGGTMLIMANVARGALGFTDEMASLALALYILYDAIGTTMNIVGNGAFVIIYNKLFGNLFNKKENK
jgi:Na+/H+-dicarboxylate symporter